MRQDNAKKLAAEETKVVQAEGNDSSLIDDIAPAVYRSSACDFGPDHEDKSNVVDPSVDTVQQIVTKLSAVWQAHEK